MISCHPPLGIRLQARFHGSNRTIAAVAGIAVSNETSPSGTSLLPTLARFFSICMRKIDLLVKLHLRAVAVVAIEVAGR